jgi:hypothetical protein
MGITTVVCLPEVLDFYLKGLTHATYKCCRKKKQMYVKCTPIKTAAFNNIEHHNNVREFLSAHLPKIWPDIEEMRKMNPNPDLNPLGSCIYGTSKDHCTCEKGALLKKLRNT